MNPSPPKDCHGQCTSLPTGFATGQCSSPSSRFRRDVENGSFRESSVEEEDTSTIPPKKETMEQHRKRKPDFCNAKKDDVDQRIQIDDQPVTEQNAVSRVDSPILQPMNLTQQVDAANPTIQPAAIEVR